MDIIRLGIVGIWGYRGESRPRENGLDIPFHRLFVEAIKT